MVLCAVLGLLCSADRGGCVQGRHGSVRCPPSPAAVRRQTHTVHGLRSRKLRLMVLGLALLQNSRYYNCLCLRLGLGDRDKSCRMWRCDFTGDRAYFGPPPQRRCPQRRRKSGATPGHSLSGKRPEGPRGRKSSPGDDGNAGFLPQQHRTIPLKAQDDILTCAIRKNTSRRRAGMSSPGCTRNLPPVSPSSGISSWTTSWLI